jgi:DNA-binding transcriptional regulator GbsR (MarR family)
MNNDAKLIYADRAGRFYVQQYGFSPIAGRLLGYLAVCESGRPTIAELADALMASRSAITGAIQTLESFHLVKRLRTAGERVDRVIMNPNGFEGNGFDAAVYSEQAQIFREGLALLQNAPIEQRAYLEEAVELSDFLAERMPALQKEWYKRRDALRTKRRQSK